MSKTAKGCAMLVVVYAVLTAASYVLLAGLVIPVGEWVRHTPLAQAVIAGGALTVALLMWLTERQRGQDKAGRR